jgi:hypothetical protein
MREYNTRSMPKPPARVDMRNMNVSLSGLLYSFMFCCRVDRLVCPSILLKAYADQNYRKQIDNMELWYIPFIGNYLK